MTRHVRRLRGALRPMTRDARLSALHRGGFRRRVRAFQSPNARLSRSFSRHPDPSQRAPRSQVIVPDGRGPGPPGAAVTSRYRGTPHLAPPSGCLRRRPSKSEDANLVAWARYVVNGVVVAQSSSIIPLTRYSLSAANNSRQVLFYPTE
jgi:hypothetical protein